jgi:hypothetical protein
MEKKTADPTKYMREYKRKQYEKNPDIIKTKNKAYYYKYKFGLTAEDMATYGELTPEVSKVINMMNKINEKNPNLIPHILGRFNKIADEAIAE